MLLEVTGIWNFVCCWILCEWFQNGWVVWVGFCYKTSIGRDCIPLQVFPKIRLLSFVTLPKSQDFAVCWQFDIHAGIVNSADCRWSVDNVTVLYCCLVLDVSCWYGGSDVSGVAGSSTFSSARPTCCAHLYIQLRSLSGLFRCVSLVSVECCWWYRKHCRCRWS